MIQWCHHPAEKKSVPGETLYARFPAAQTAARHRGSHPSVHAGTGRREVWGTCTLEHDLVTEETTCDNVDEIQVIMLNGKSQAKRQSQVYVGSKNICHAGAESGMDICTCREHFEIPFASLFLSTLHLLSPSFSLFLTTCFLF